MGLKVAIIGGTGVGERLAEMGGYPLFVPSREGMLRGRVVTHEGVEILTVSRHSAGHKLPPHRVNFGAIALGLKQLGVRGVFSTAAVGSLRIEWKPGTLAAISDFVDISSRNLTLYEDVVQHCDMSDAFSGELRDALLAAADERRIGMLQRAVYVNVNGPRYESPAEIQVYARFRGDVVGMTAGSEAIMMAEAGVPYACLGIVTNYAAGLSDETLNHQEVVQGVESVAEELVPLLLTAALRVAKG
jgi:5'-methylthioadenosine phosphorylase